MEQTSTTLQSYQELATLLEKEFHLPDLQALRIVMAACRAQFSSSDPVWLFIIGPSGSGKTAIAINSISGLPNTHIESSISPKTMLSCASVGDSKSLLTHIGSGILAFKDFTTIISKNEDSQREIISQFREIYDGKYSSKTGVEWRSWEGKLTVIAAVTPALEKAWMVHRDLGERFMQVRWPNTNPEEMAARALQQCGREKQTASVMRELACKWFLASGKSIPILPNSFVQPFISLSTCIAFLRAKVTREKKEIIDTSPHEEPTRIVKALSTICCHHAALMGREPENADALAAMRMGLDSIPSKRIAILAGMPMDSPISVNALAELTKTDRRSLTYHIDDLVALNILESVGEDLVVGSRFAIHSLFLPYWKRSKLP